MRARARARAATRTQRSALGAPRRVAGAGTAMVPLLLLSTLLLAAAAPAQQHLPYVSLQRPPLQRLPVKKDSLSAALRRVDDDVKSAPWCTPSDSCWPTPAEWAAFNASVKGHLLALTPPLVACFPGPAADADACGTAVGRCGTGYLRLPSALSLPLPPKLHKRRLAQLGGWRNAGSQPGAGPAER